jgi:hypothetical protein
MRVVMTVIVRVVVVVSVRVVVSEPVVVAVPVPVPVAVFMRVTVVVVRMPVPVVTIMAMGMSVIVTRSMRVPLAMAVHRRMQRVVHHIEGHRIEDRERSGLQARIVCGRFDCGGADAVAEQGQGFVEQRGGRRVPVQRGRNLRGEGGVRHGASLRPQGCGDARNDIASVHTGRAPIGTVPCESGRVGAGAPIRGAIRPPCAAVAGRCAVRSANASGR